MPEYANHGGESPIVRYELSPDSITITFSDGSTYLYDAERPGPILVDRMKALAATGRGLDTYILTEVRKNYARKLR